MDNGTGPDTTVEESALVKLARQGDEDAFAELVRRHQRMVYTACVRLVGDAHEAADCAQEAFLKAYRSLKGFREDARFSTWVHRIAVRTCLSRLSSPWHRWRKRIVPAAVWDQDDQPVGRMPDRRLSPASDFVRQERAQAVRDAVMSLPNDQRTVVVLRDIDGYSYEEIAILLKVNVGTVKSRLSRARQALAELLKGVMADEV